MNRILIIENDIPLSNNIAELLNENGYQTFQALNGAEALKVIETELPDLVIFDLMMSEVPERETLAMSNESKAVSSVPFIFLTAVADERFQGEGPDRVTDSYIKKPYDAEELLRAVKDRILNG